MAVLPLSPTTSSLVWTVDKGDVAALLSLPEEAFLEAVNTALYSRRGEQGLALAVNQVGGMAYNGKVHLTGCNVFVLLHSLVDTIVSCSEYVLDS